jgi:formate dehydrogenase major subunit
MSDVNITINGHPAQVPDGITILEAAKRLGVEIPTLCHHPALQDIGACRLCVVEVSGRREVQPACVFPVSDKLVIQTETPKTAAMRRFALEMLFSERSHYCMYCEMSGDCELQSLAYRYGLDRSAYPVPHEHLPVDATRQYFIMDHNRCILCRRCIRACGELAGNFTLGLKARGAKTIISADMDAPLGESSCVACGTCLQVCPTGALIDIKSVYGGRDFQVSRVKSSCSRCSVGCAIDVVTRSERALRVEGDWEGSNRGILCVSGRFESLNDPRERLTSPMVRERGELAPVSWEKAMDAAVDLIRSAGSGGLAARITGGATDETLDEFLRLFRDRLGITPDAAEAPFAAADLPDSASLADFDDADCILIVGADPLKSHRVAGYRIRMAQRRGAMLLIASDLDDSSNGFRKTGLARTSVEDGIRACLESEKPIVVVGAKANRTETRRLTALESHAQFLLLDSAANGAYLRRLGMRNSKNGAGKKTAYLLLSEASQDGAMAKASNGVQSLILHASYAGPLTERADVALPAPLGFESEGHFTNCEGERVRINRAVPPPEGMMSEREVLSHLASRL